MEWTPTNVLPNPVNLVGRTFRVEVAVFKAGCQYLECEDVASKRRTVHDVDESAEVALCPAHDAFVAESEPDLIRRCILVGDVAGRCRVKVLMPARRQITATPIESDLPGRNLDKDLQGWMRRQLESVRKPIAAGG